MSTLTYCMSSHCPLARDCLRFEDDAASHALKRTYADFSEELIRRDGQVSCPFFVAHPQPAAPLALEYS